MTELFNYDDYRQYLSDYYKAKKLKTPGFSHRYIGNKIGFSPGYFSRVLSGEKNLSNRYIFAFIHFLKLNRSQSAYFEAMVHYNQTKELSEKTVYYERMLQYRTPKSGRVKKDQYEYYAHWYHSAIRAMVGICKGARDFNLEKMAARFVPSISVKALKNSLKLLTRLGFLSEKEGQYEVNHQYIKSGDKPKEIAIQNYLQELSTMGARAVKSVPADQRKYYTATLGISSECHAKINSRVQELFKEINQLVANDKKADQVFQLNVQIFPLSQKIHPEEL